MANLLDMPFNHQADRIWVEHSLIPHFTARDPFEYWIGRDEERKWISSQTQGCDVAITPAKGTAPIEWGSDQALYVPFDVTLSFQNAEDMKAFKAWRQDLEWAERARRVTESVLTSLQSSEQPPEGFSLPPGPMYHRRPYLFAFGPFECEVEMVAAWIGTGHAGVTYFMQSDDVVGHVKTALRRLEEHSMVDLSQHTSAPMQLKFAGWPDFSQILRQAMSALSIADLRVRRRVAQDLGVPVETERPALRVVGGTSV